VKDDLCLAMIREHGLKPQAVLEVGCADGWRLEAIRQEYGAKCAGVDVSSHALDAGLKMHRQVHCSSAAADDLSIFAEDTFDLVLLPFVLHWVARSVLACTVAEVDRVLKPGGHLLIADFYPNRPTKARYHHRPEVEAWTYKQEYPDCWLFLQTYKLVDWWTFNHATGLRDDMVLGRERAAVALLVKEEQYCESV
jgi:ubiquinone/menaquinone biosynthesis C-methylase UbiE